MHFILSISEFVESKLDKKIISDICISLAMEKEMKFIINTVTFANLALIYFGFFLLLEM